jgi:penicillin V acylase-like amidase (Ntn superfamily)
LDNFAFTQWYVTVLSAEAACENVREKLTTLLLTDFKERRATPLNFENLHLVAQKNQGNSINVK